MSSWHVDIGDLEELNGILEQQERLEAVLAFLEEYGADEEMLGAINEAIKDLEFFLNETLLVKTQRELPSMM